MKNIFHLLLFASVVIPGIALSDIQSDRYRSGDPLIKCASSLQAKYAYGMYFNEVKVGWAITEGKISSFDGEDVYLDKYTMEFTFNTEGVLSTTRIDGNKIYGLKGNGEILYAESNILDDGENVIIKVKRDIKGLVAKVQSGREINTKIIKNTKDNFMKLCSMVEWVSLPKEIGDKIDISEFNIDSVLNNESIDIDMYFSYKGTRRAIVNGVPVEVSKVSSSANDGLTYDAEILPAFTFSKIHLGGITLKLENEEVAKRIDLNIPDMFGITEIDTVLKENEGSDYLKIRIASGDKEDIILPQSRRQKIFPETDSHSIIMEIVRDKDTGKHAPLSVLDRERYLQVTIENQSDSEEINNLTLSIVGNAITPVESSYRIQDWIYNNIEGSYKSNATTSLQVLANKAGDCTEASLLFISLARSVGIPAREVTGLVYSSDGASGFYWHAWAEIHDGSQWVTVDPAWNQVYVDAHHLKLSDDVEIYRWMSLAGKLEIEILDYNR